MALGRVVVYSARAAHAFSAGIKCRHCRPHEQASIGTTLTSYLCIWSKKHTLRCFHSFGSCVSPFINSCVLVYICNITINKHTVPTFNSCTKCVSSPGRIDDHTPDCHLFSWTWIHGLPLLLKVALSSCVSSLINSFVLVYICTITINNHTQIGRDDTCHREVSGIMS